MISGVVGVVGIYYLRQITKADQELYSFNTVPLASIGSLGTKYQELRVLFRTSSRNRTTVGGTRRWPGSHSSGGKTPRPEKDRSNGQHAGEEKAPGESEKRFAAYGKAMDKMSGSINSGMAEVAKGVLQTDGLLAARQLNDAITKLFDASWPRAAGHRKRIPAWRTGPA